VAQVGRISGPLLTANLERNGIDLKFRNTLDQDVLLYLDVNNGRIGINKDVASIELDLSNETYSTTNQIATNADIANYNISNNNLNVLVGNIYLNASESINLSNFETDNLHISDNSISTYRSNSDIELVPNGTGTVEIFNDLQVNANLHATGNVTFDGNITFGNAGDDSTYPVDTVVFNTDVDSNIVPSTHIAYDLGLPDRRWDELYTVLVNGGTITSTTVDLSGIDPYTLRQGNIIYVAQNGDDANVGDHPNGSFKTLRRALAFADASIDGPVTVFVYAGGYEEELPLEVPSQVSIIGEDMRNTIIRPESAYQSEDVFLLNGESTVQNLTVKDFYYDSGNDTGYAFRFAPNTVVTTRSPYVQNVTVITQGTTTSASDPRGFASGDAGKGALIDGADVTSASEEASMLFHSVTFITPGVDAVTMTNGVRVEWLNSFTYFANRGLYAVDGVTGHLSTDGSTVKYGAELRSIGSANVYGNYGAVADGADTLMYLIQHNFAYIGVGKYVDNDPSRVIQSQEVTELNSGKIYYQSIDHLGNFRVGNEFFVDQEAGTTTLTLSEADIDAINGLNINTNGNLTVVDGTKIETGNIRISGNLIESISGNINLASVGTTNFLTNVAMSQNLSMTGNITIDGSLITLGNQNTDTVAFNAEFPQDVIPDISGRYDLGKGNKRWSNAWLSQAQISDIKFQDNFITTTESNADLDLRANGTGEILIPDNNVVVDNNLTVDGVTDLQDINLTGNITHVGDSFQTGGYASTNYTVTQDLTVGSYVQLEEILIDGNVITTTSSNADLELRAAGTGEIIVPYTDVIIENNLSTRDLSLANLNVQSNITSVELIASSDIKIRDNFIETTQANNNLLLRANGTGEVYTPSAVQINQNLTVNNNMTFSGDLSGDDILGSDSIAAAQDFNANILHTDSIDIWDNNIATVVSNANLELRAVGTGTVFLQQVGFTDNILGAVAPDSTSGELDLTTLGNAYITSTSALLLPVGTNAQRLTGEEGQIRFSTTDNVFEGYSTGIIGFGGIYSADRGESVVVDPTSNNINIFMNTAVDPIDSTSLVGEVTGTGFRLHGLQVDDVLVNNNVITTNVSNSDLELVRNGTGEIDLNDLRFKDNLIKNNSGSDLTLAATNKGYIKFGGTFGVVIPNGNNTTDRGTGNQIGDTRWNTTDGFMEVYDGSTWISAAGGGSVVTSEFMEDLSNEWTLILG